jgi:hypothetical protein
MWAMGAGADSPTVDYWLEIVCAQLLNLHPDILCLTSLHGTRRGADTHAVLLSLSDPTEQP